MRKREIHAISTGRQSFETLLSISKEIHPLIDAIHIREKHKSAAELYQLVSQLIKEGIPQEKLILNDRVDLAFALKLGGVQLAYHSLPAALVKEAFPVLRIGCSIHSVEEATLAMQAGADYLLYGHIYPTQSKPGLVPRGLEDIALIKKRINLPLFALGGITPSNAPDVFHAGADGIAVMSGIFESSDPLTAAKAYANMLDL